MVRIYLRYLALALLTWLITNLAGAFVTFSTNPIGLRFREIVILGMLFSCPSVFVLIGSCFHLSTLRTWKKRLIYSVYSSVYTTLLISGLFFLFLEQFPNLVYFVPHAPQSFADHTLLVAPFMLAAPFAFVMVAHGIIFSPRMIFTKNASSQNI